MSNFFDALNDELLHGDNNKTLTANGDVTYISAGDSLVDFSYSVNSLRNRSTKEIAERFARCYIDNPMLATKMMFQIGDVREGKGERRTFNTCLRYMALEHPEIAKALLPLVSEYTRWSHVAEMVTCGNPDVQRAARQLIAEQLKKDYAAVQKIEAGKKASLTLCAKWAPALGAKKDGRHKIALRICDEMGITHKEYRKMRAAIIKHLNVIETNLSQGTLEEVNFENMTSKQQMKYAAKMQEKAGDAYNEYLDKVESGEAKMNSAVNTPADIVYRYVEHDSWDTSVRPYDKTLELLWKNLKDTVGSPEGGVIVVRDDSGSMTVEADRGNSQMTCLDVATALALYCAERLPEPFKDKFLSFSRTPKYLDVSRFDTLHDKLRYAYEHSEVANTDVEATLKVVLQTAIKQNLAQEQIPSVMLFLSDMEFDQGSYNNGMSVFDNARAEWASHGLQMPTVAFWNLNSQRAVVPTIDDRGVILLSGFTTDNLDLVMSGELAQFTPAKQLEFLLSKERYDAVGEAFEAGLASERESTRRNVTQGRYAELIPETKATRPAKEDNLPSAELDEEFEYDDEDEYEYDDDDDWR